MSPRGRNGLLPGASLVHNAPMRPSFPFSAIVGQEEMKRALLIAAVDARVGGVMVFGDRGTGKSTAVRALAALLPPISAAAAGYQDGSVKKGKVPVTGSSTCRWARRRIAWSARSIWSGRWARASRRSSRDCWRARTAAFSTSTRSTCWRITSSILLLDVAASGENVVEREGLSVRHPARFVLVGSGNPEEGELRPQLLDRFGLSVDVRTPGDIAQRVEILKRCDAFEREPDAFAETWRREEARTLKQIAAGRAALPGVSVPDAVLAFAARLCLAVGADGLRGELTLMRAARALAALERVSEATTVHVAAIAPLALRHRLRRNVLDETGSTVRIERALAEMA